MADPRHIMISLCLGCRRKWVKHPRINPDIPFYDPNNSYHCDAWCNNCYVEYDVAEKRFRKMDRILRKEELRQKELREKEIREKEMREKEMCSETAHKPAGSNVKKSVVIYCLGTALCLVFWICFDCFIVGDDQ